MGKEHGVRIVLDGRYPEWERAIEVADLGQRDITADAVSGDGVNSIGEP